jgi:hypothetical protein
MQLPLTLEFVQGGTVSCQLESLCDVETSEAAAFRLNSCLVSCMYASGHKDACPHAVIYSFESHCCIIVPVAADDSPVLLVEAINM